MPWRSCSSEMMERMNQILDALTEVKPSPSDVQTDTVTFSPLRWKIGWPHHLRRVPPFRDDATASISRSEVFAFAADARDSGYARDQVIDFLGACFGYTAGQSNDVMKLQAFLRNKGNASKLLAAVRRLEGLGAVEAYASLVGTGLAPKYASAVAYFLAGEQTEGESEKPVIICSKRAAVAGLASDSDWSGEEYAEYLSALRAGRVEVDTALPLDAVEWALQEFN